VKAFCSAAILLCLLGCARLQPGNDPIVVRAEQATAVAVEVFDAFLKWDVRYEGTAVHTPEARAVAREIRANGINWLETARALTTAYKRNRSDANRANLQAGLAVLSEATARAEIFLR